MKIRALLGLFLLLPWLAPLHGEELNNWIGKDHKIFSANRPRFITRQFAPYLRWTSGEKTEARYPGYANSPKLTYFGYELQECIFRFQDEKMSSIYLSVYNRGDAGELSVDGLNRMVSGLSEQISRALQQPLPQTKKERLGNGFSLWKRIWLSGEYRYLMQWSFTDRRAEYLQLKITPAQSGPEPQSGNLRDAKLHSDEELRRNVRRDQAENVWIDNVPMVDQGQKGYCVVAVIERVLRYYGADVSQHVFAQLASSSAANGTSTEAIKTVLKDLGGKLGVRVTERFNLIANGRDVQRLCEKYNTAAKRAKKPKVFAAGQRNGRHFVYDVDATLRQMDPEVYQTARLYDKSEMRGFFSDVKMHIDRGLPVVWSVILGIVPENEFPRQEKGGHMRLLIGYNAKTQEVFYTDTWGAGHERKSMHLMDAWAITTLTLFLDPR